jgi:hypothetical protein
MNENALTENELMQLEALVDGELPEPQYANLLSRLDQATDGWKLCALSFLEHQAMEREVRTFTRSKLSESLTATVAPAFDTQQESMQSTVLWTRTELPLRQPSIAHSNTVTKKTSRPTSQPIATKPPERRVVSSLMMLAASIAIAFTSGFMTSEWRANRDTELNKNISMTLPAQIDSLDSALDDVEQALADQIAYEGLDPNQTYNIDTPSNNEAYGMEPISGLPVHYTDPIDSSLLESKERKIVRLNSLVDAEMERVQSFVPYTRDDGQEVVVPVQNLKFRPIAVHGF